MLSLGFFFNFKRSSRKAKESAYERQIRMAIEQSKRDAVEEEAKRLFLNGQCKDEVIMIDVDCVLNGTKVVDDCKVDVSNIEQSRTKLADISLESTGSFY